METAKVTTCTKIKDWTGKDGKAVPIYKVEFSDGTFGESFAKEIPQGTLASDLIIEEGQYGKKIKLKNTGGGGGAKARSGSDESFALSYAKDLGCAHIAAGQKFGSKEILEVAEAFYGWLQSKKAKA